MKQNPKKQPVSPSLKKNIDYLKKELAVDKSFDLVFLELNYGGIDMALFTLDAFAKDEALTQIQRELNHIDEADKDDILDHLMKSRIPYVELEKVDDLEDAVTEILSGPAVLLIDGVSEGIVIDTREYEIRGPEEPESEQVIRGSRDGFVETLVFNAGLVRRRVRDRNLRNEFVRVGRRSLSDCCVTYIADIADPKLVEHIKKGLEEMDTDGLPMGDKTVEEFLFGDYTNPYPVIRYTERPDVASSHLLEGHVLIMVDGSPSVIITPASFWHHLQHAEEYRHKPIVGSTLRLVRFAAVWTSIFLLPLWFVFAENPGLLPDQLAYIGVDEPGEVPLIGQFIAAEIGIEMLRMAAIHTPTALGTALGLVAAILIGEVAIEVGLFTHEVVLYLSIAAIGSFATPSYEMSLANRMMRIALLILCAFFHVPGYMIGATLLILLLASMKAFHVPYLWPFLPFNRRGARDVLFRAPMPLKNRRPRALHPIDPDR
ncbi:spore germination protein [Alteribacter natronophilus]|uniref:spore germination protein n=1 Tax=Alteribacter natronophilus TaxID=2583810 RepID=UPI00110EA2E0|nr:spore germination protein [Alteribacter natronophilus]TMW73799.1 spore germination protein [Alteribacter natronophilus]